MSATAVSSARLREFGVTGYLPKPFAMPTLVELVEGRRARNAAGDEPTPAEATVEVIDAR